MQQDLIASSLDAARQCRILVCTSLAYRPARLQQWFEMLRSLADFPVARLDVLMQVNSDTPGDLANIDELCALMRSPSKSFQAEVFIPPAHSPYDLCWAHKRHIRDRFLAGADHTHFVYLEDDMRFGFTNFCYFLHARELLRPHGLVPSFVRYEWSETSRFVHSTDQTAPSNLHGRRAAHCGEYRFVNLDNPYCAMFVLDRELAAEYVASPSFDPAASRSVCDFGVPERAAMGLCYEAVPDGFTSRHAIPVLAEADRIASIAWVHHLTNTYASLDTPNNYFGRLRMDHLLKNDPAAAMGAKPRAHSVRWFRSGDSH